MEPLPDSSEFTNGRPTERWVRLTVWIVVAFLTASVILGMFLY